VSWRGHPKEYPSWFSVHTEIAISPRCCTRWETWRIMKESLLV